MHTNKNTYTNNVVIQIIYISYKNTGFVFLLYIHIGMLKSKSTEQVIINLAETEQVF